MFRFHGMSRINICRFVSTSTSLVDALGRKKNDGMLHTVLIDGSPLIFRAHFGIESTLTNKDGLEVTAVFGFTRLLLKLRNSIDADFVGCFLDDKSPTFRKEMFGPYKAMRKAVPESLIPQLGMIEGASNACGIFTLKKPGFEADDLIATYATLAERRGHKVTIVSPDKDMMQLVGKNVLFYDPAKRLLLDEVLVTEKWGVATAKIPHIQALTGDKSDNIPGAAGIGPKIATSLISKYGSIENLLGSELQEESKKICKILQTYKNEIELSLKLATLSRDVNVPDIERLRFKPIDKEALHCFLKENQFYSIIKQQFGSEYVAATPREVKSARERMSEIKGVTICHDKQTASAVLEKLMKLSGENYVHACDTEVGQIDLSVQGPVGNGKVICASIYCGEDFDFGNGPRIWIDNLDEAEGTLDLFKEFFEDKKYLKVWHNVGFDRHILFNHGINVKGFAGDTMHMARLWDSSRRFYSLETLSEELLENCTPKVGMKKRFGQLNTLSDGSVGKDVVLPPLEDLQRDSETVVDWIDYSTLDAEATFKLFHFLKEKLKAMAWHGNKSLFDFYEENWKPFGELLTDMEREGIEVDLKHLQEMEVVATKDAMTKQDKFLSWARQFSEEAYLMNPKSIAQKQQFFFAPSINSKTREELPATREFTTENKEGLIKDGRNVPSKRRTFQLTGLGIPPVGYSASGWPSVGQAELMELAGIEFLFYRLIVAVVRLLLLFICLNLFGFYYLFI